MLFQRRMKFATVIKNKGNLLVYTLKKLQSKMTKMRNRELESALSLSQYFF